jgi:hypothetical protein
MGSYRNSYLTTCLFRSVDLLVLLVNVRHTVKPTIQLPNSMGIDVPNSMGWGTVVDFLFDSQPAPKAG